MSDTNGTPRHVSIEQIKLMIEFMSQHVDFAVGKLRCLEARHKSKGLWEELTAHLNEYSGGVKKSSYGWSKYWSDWKNKLKKKTKPLPKKGSYEVRLTKLEKRALDILGPSFDKKTRNDSASYNNYTNLLPPRIKVETYQENESNNISGDERISDEHSDSSPDEDIDDPNQNSSEPLHNLYPKWLIEVEKKRADAELLRAKAEEQRASVAGKAAEAALIQADALKMLAEATSNQADALMRIALVLEARGERDVLAI